MEVTFTETAPLHNYLDVWNELIAAQAVKHAHGLPMDLLEKKTHLRGRFLHRHKNKAPKRGWPGKHWQGLKDFYLTTYAILENVRLTHVGDLYLDAKSDKMCQPFIFQYDSLPE